MDDETLKLLEEARDQGFSDGYRAGLQAALDDLGKRLKEVSTPF